MFDRRVTIVTFQVAVYNQNVKDNKLFMAMYKDLQFNYFKAYEKYLNIEYIDSFKISTLKSHIKKANTVQTFQNEYGTFC